MHRTLTSTIRSQIRSLSSSNSANVQHIKNDPLSNCHSSLSTRPGRQTTAGVLLTQSRSVSTPNSSTTQNSQAELFNDIHKVLATGLDDQYADGLSHTDRNLCDISQYYFDGKGKAIRPRLSLTVADAVNQTLFPGITSFTFAFRQKAPLGWIWHYYELS